VTGKERRLNIEVEVALFRITQEALHNIEHHARPTRALVTLNLGNSEVKI
jgi:signal transduction histidine kinase